MKYGYGKLGGTQHLNFLSFINTNMQLLMRSFAVMDIFWSGKNSNDKR